MKAMILAAGLGKRMRPLTEHTPKPLLEVNGTRLIEFHLDRLRKAGITDIVINTHWLGEMIHQHLGDGKQFGVHIQYSHEERLLETAGGIAKALPGLSDGKEPFLVINGDIYLDVDLTDWLAHAPELDEHCQAYLALVPNPSHHTGGDFCMDEASVLSEPKAPSSNAYTYAGLALFHPSLFDGVPAEPSQLGPLLKHKMASNVVVGRVLTDYWLDVGTPERLEELKQHLS